MIDRVDDRLSKLPLLSDLVRPWLLLLVIAVATLLGGSAVPALAFAVELMALPLLVLILTNAPPPPSERLTRLARWLCGAIMLVIAAQLVPLPGDWARALPGRETATAIREAIGLSGSFPFPLSLDPQATLGSGLSLIPSVAILLAGLRATPEEMARAIALFVAIAGASALLGLYQITTGGPYFYDYAHIGQSTGIFANRNHHGAMILAAMLLAVMPAERWADTTPRRICVAVGMIIFSLCAVLTTSRATLLLLPAALGAALALVLVRSRITRSYAVLTTVLCVVVLALATRLPIIAPVINRLATAGTDGRFGYWEDSIVAMREMWPAGSGFGTFPVVYATVENLDTLKQSYVNHAHNEVLELLIEGGAMAAALLLAWAMLVAAAAVRALQTGNLRASAAALAAIGLIVLISLTEFPLRNFAVATGFALAHVVLLRAGDRQM